MIRIVNAKLLLKNQGVERDLERVAKRYESQKDARWLFAFAHYRITQQINQAATIPGAFRDPDALIRFNISFATAFLAAVAGQSSYPWKKAFAECAVAEISYGRSDGCSPYAVADCHTNNVQAVKVCAIAMANAHINTDIVNSLKSVGCIDLNDYANILLFVERGAKEAIVRLHGRTFGATYNALKEWFAPLDRIWRNSVYQQTCGVAVPGIDVQFIIAVDRHIKEMVNIKPSR